jgi:hypothetical protein
LIYDHFALGTILQSCSSGLIIQSLDVFSATAAAFSPNSAPETRKELLQRCEKLPERQHHNLMKFMPSFAIVKLDLRRALNFNGGAWHRGEGKVKSCNTS